MGEHEIRTANAKPAAVFLDRDGVLNAAVVRDGRPYPPAAVAEFVLLPGVVEACEKLRAAGYRLVVVTNQPDVGRGTQTRAEVDAMHARLRALAPGIDRVEVCFHGGTDFGQPCDCRKPAPGMVLAAARALDIDLAKSWLVGDRWRDIDCGHAAGCRTIFIDYGYAEKLRQPPDFCVHSLSEAAQIVLENRR
ncbi:MAG: HAD family hydrolase [Verrucomicrobia bacterium]|nr:HAD family hydrolase [Verrucomicrobiota bacterium]